MAVILALSWINAAFGQAIITESKFSFTGKEQDSSYLHYFGARYYDANLGRFTSVDPIDDLTFWYTQEYIPITGTFTWQTRIASFIINMTKDIYYAQK